MHWWSVIGDQWSMIGNQLSVIGVCWSVTGDWLSVIIDEWLRQATGDRWSVISGRSSVIGYRLLVFVNQWSVICHCWSVMSDLDTLLETVYRWSVVVNQWSMIMLFISERWSGCWSPSSLIGNQLLVIGVCWSVIGDWLSMIIDEWLRQTTEDRRSETIIMHWWSVIGDQWLLISDWLSVIGVCESVIGGLSLLISHEWLRHTSGDRANRWSVVVNQWSMITLFIFERWLVIRLLIVECRSVISDQTVDRWTVISDQTVDRWTVISDQTVHRLQPTGEEGEKNGKKEGRGRKRGKKRGEGGRKKGKKGEGEEEEMAFKIEHLEGEKAKIFGARSAPFFGQPARQRWPLRRRGKSKRKRRQLAIEWWKPHLSTCCYCGDIAFQSWAFFIFLISLWHIFPKYLCFYFTSLYVFF